MTGLGLGPQELFCLTEQVKMPVKGPRVQASDDWIFKVICVGAKGYDCGSAKTSTPARLRRAHIRGGGSRTGCDSI